MWTSRCEASKLARSWARVSCPPFSRGCLLLGSADYYAMCLRRGTEVQHMEDGGLRICSRSPPWRFKFARPTGTRASSTIQMARCAHSIMRRSDSASTEHAESPSRTACANQRAVRGAGDDADRPSASGCFPAPGRRPLLHFVLLEDVRLHLVGQDCMTGGRRVYCVPE